MQAKLRVCLLVVFSMGCATLFDTVAACDGIGILACNKLLGTSVQSLTEGVMPDANTLIHACSILDNYTTCVDEKLTGCGSQLKLVLDSVKDVVDFMCRDSYQAILDNSECWIKPVFKSDINQCQLTYKETAKRLKGQIRTHFIGATEMYRQLCEAMHTVTNCMSSAGKTRCDSDAELIMHNMINAALRRTYKIVRSCSAPNLNIIGSTSTITTSATSGSRTTTPILNRIGTTTIEPVTASAVSGSRTIITSGSSTTKYSYALYVTSIIACIVVLAV